jgi:hypothetical protein
MIKLKDLLKENHEIVYFEPDSFEDLQYVIDAHTQHSLHQISSGVKEQSWNTLPPERVNKIWKLYGEKGIIRDIKGLGKITSHILNNVCKLQSNNIIAGHESYGVDEEELEHYGFESNDDLWEKMGDYIGDRISDYGLPQIWEIVNSHINNKSPENILIMCDKILNVIHQRNDLSAMFIKGGSFSLDMISGNKDD